MSPGSSSHSARRYWRLIMSVSPTRTWSDGVAIGAGSCDDPGASPHSSVGVNARYGMLSITQHLVDGARSALEAAGL